MLEEAKFCSLDLDMIIFDENKAGIDTCLCENITLSKCIIIYVDEQANRQINKCYCNIIAEMEIVQFKESLLQTLYIVRYMHEFEESE